MFKDRRAEFWNLSTFPKSTKPPIIPTGTYQIVNQHTGAYAGLLNTDDRSGVVGLTAGLGGHDKRGLIVCRRFL